MKYEKYITKYAYNIKYFTSYMCTYTLYFFFTMYNTRKNLKSSNVNTHIHTPLINILYKRNKIFIFSLFNKNLKPIFFFLTWLTNLANLLQIFNSHILTFTL